MTHAEFVDAYRSGTVRIDIDRAEAARFISRRLLLPFAMLPVLGTGIALALIGWVWTGLAVIAAGTLVPVLIKRSAPHFILTQALQDERFYDDVAASGLLQIRKGEPRPG